MPKHVTKAEYYSLKKLQEMGLTARDASNISKRDWATCNKAFRSATWEDYHNIPTHTPQTSQSLADINASLLAIKRDLDILIAVTGETERVYEPTA